MRIPAAFCGITSLKPTAGRLPLHGQGLDGGLIGVVGLCNTLGFMARSAKSIDAIMGATLGDHVKGKICNDARFVPLDWNEQRAKHGEKLKIGW